MERIDNPRLMDPALPPDGTRRLEDSAVELASVAAGLAGKLSADTVRAVSVLVRSMNCYYSNLIEGHNTHPIDIERALRGEYSQEPQKRDLQLEAFAHIEVQALIDDDSRDLGDIPRTEYVLWLHREFCQRLPVTLLRNRDPKTDREVEVVPGAFRDGEVIVGSHVAPIASELPRFMQYFEERYEVASLSKVMRIIAVAASHHRLLWIHPFFDGNGRVARLFSHAFLKELGVGSALWSVSRGLARNVTEYKASLIDADRWREGDTDGRGSLSLRGLTAFCDFFLSVCIDQVKFMDALLEPAGFIERVRRYCSEQIEQKEMPRGSFEVLREIILLGALPRARVEEVTGYKERQARSIVARLLELNLIRTSSVRSPLELNIPHNVVGAWFPRLYPGDL